MCVCVCVFNQYQTNPKKLRTESFIVFALFIQQGKGRRKVLMVVSTARLPNAPVGKHRKEMTF